jgi:hypothetical protein
VLQGLQPQWDGQARELGTLWTSRKGRQTARCVVVTHPLGWELRLSVANELIRSQVHRDQGALLTDADAWKAAMLEKGWSC